MDDNSAHCNKGIVLPRVWNKQTEKGLEYKDSIREIKKWIVTRTSLANYKLIWQRQEEHL